MLNLIIVICGYYMLKSVLNMIQQNKIMSNGTRF
jgi:hypothetical protein